MVPIKRSENWEVRIVYRRISYIANKGVDPIPIGIQPGSRITNMPFLE